MSMVTLTGDAALDRAFKELPVVVQKKILREVMRPAAKAVMDVATGLVPVQSGALRASLKVRAAKRSRATANRVSFNVITGVGTFKGPTYYGAFVDLGHRLGSRKLGNKRSKVPGKNFMKSALDTAGPRAKETALAALKEAIEREASALGRS